MRKPSIKTLNKVFPGKGRELRRLLDSAAAVREHPAAIALETISYNPHDLYTLRLEALNAVAGTYGVEHVTRGRNARSPAFDYLNTGDTYTPTIVRFADGRYCVARWGDIVERGDYE